MPGRLQDGFQRREPDELRGLNRCLVFERRCPHGFESYWHRGLLQVRQVHRDLRPAANLQPERLDARQPAIALLHLPGDGSGHLAVVGVEVGVEGD